MQQTRQDIKQESEDEIVFIGDPSQQIHINKHEDNHALESKQVLQCVFSFARKDSVYGRALQSILMRMIHDLAHKLCVNELLYRDDEESAFYIYMRADSQTILSFANTLSAMPLGLDFVFKEIEPLSIDDFNGVKNADSISIHKCIESVKDSINPLLIPNADEMHALLDGAKKSLLFQDLDITHFVRLESYNTSLFNTHVAIQTEHLIQHEIVGQLALILTRDSKITLSRNGITFTLSLKPLDGNKFIVFSNLDSAQSYLRMSEAQKSMLASFEKPFIHIQCKEIFAKEFGAYSVFAGLSCDIIVLLLLSHLQKVHDISYLFYMPQIDSESSDNVAILSYTDAYPYIYDSRNKILESTYNVAEHVYISHLQTHKSLSALLVSNRTESARFIAFLSTQHKSEFLIEQPHDTESRLQQILNISFSTDLYVHLAVLHGYKNGDKLIYNFVKANTEIVKKWNLRQDELEKLGISELVTHSSIAREQGRQTGNLLDIFELVVQILDIESSVLLCANRCVRDRGPRIDYKLTRQGDSIVLDYARLLRSVMSFQLAGVESELLCYGVIDSLAEFIGTLASDMMLNYGIQEAFVCGDLLLWQCFFDKIVKAIPKNMHATFPKSGGTDYLD